MTIQSVILQPETQYQTASRTIQTRKGTKLEISNMFLTGVRQTAIRQGVMFNFSQNENQTTEKEVMKPPRTEPLEYAWKKMNI
ncbi:hypothetical protein BK742_13300 [Bacillus thuringiensis serovar pingluonsis]|uniref:Uncharacterized protein n=1 Tax=Bacillus thuringiensis serovar pingluonsis TaxID=180881 RepID=A0A243BER6_BACTU|nr:MULTISPECIES: hypothetical protein [Bacillus cereus group]MEB9683593.1 hypothetical protein [Bacillus anthracis]OTY44599.1 hypothetical protein BK742_13300 [Bacillus thuringiensis serovar pingluonsis]